MAYLEEVAMAPVGIWPLDYSAFMQVSMFTNQKRPSKGGWEVEPRIGEPSPGNRPSVLGSAALN